VTRDPPGGARAVLRLRPLTPGESTRRVRRPPRSRRWTPPLGSVLDARCQTSRAPSRASSLCSAPSAPWTAHASPGKWPVGVVPWSPVIVDPFEPGGDSSGRCSTHGASAHRGGLLCPASGWQLVAVMRSVALCCIAVSSASGSRRWTAPRHVAERSGRLPAAHRRRQDGMPRGPKGTHTHRAKVAALVARTAGVAAAALGARDLHCSVNNKSEVTRQSAYVVKAPPRP
jgi:hypothetical protein